MNRFSLLLLLPTLLAFSSCVTIEPETYPEEPPPERPHSDSDHVAIPPFSWELEPAGTGYHLDILMGDRDFHITDGGEFVNARQVSRNHRQVPRGTVSAFEVYLPDGEIDLYWVEEGRPGTLVVFRKFYDAQDNVWDQERRLRSIKF